MTKQEYYDLLVKTSAEGGFPALTEEGMCLYRTPDGRKCAVGLLIPDEAYEQGMDYGGDSKTSLVLERYPGVASFFPDGMTTNDVSCVQAAHDMNAIKGGWDHAAFVRGLNALHCFRGVTQAEA